MEKLHKDTFLVFFLQIFAAKACVILKLALLFPSFGCNFRENLLKLRAKRQTNALLSIKMSIFAR